MLVSVLFVSSVVLCLVTIMSSSEESEVEVSRRCSDSEDLVVNSSVDNVSHPNETSLSETETLVNHDDSNLSQPSQLASQSARAHPEVKTKR